MIQMHFYILYLDTEKSEKLKPNCLKKVKINILKKKQQLLKKNPKRSSMI